MFTPLMTRDCDGGEGSESPETKAAVDSFLKAFHQKDLLKYSQLKMAFRDLDTEKKGALDYDDMKKAGGLV
jgi:Ca2+-binding EF-hand superfamily protein